jgi:hypothetical protein
LSRCGRVWSNGARVDATQPHGIANKDANHGRPIARMPAPIAAPIGSLVDQRFDELIPSHFYSLPSTTVDADHHPQGGDLTPNTLVPHQTVSRY